MIIGRVTDDGREAIVVLRPSSPTGSERSTDVRAVVDTGFTDWLTRPTAVAEYMNLPVRGSVDAELADGSVEQLPVYRVRVSWRGRRCSVRAYGASTDEALIGYVVAARQPLDGELRARRRRPHRGTLTTGLWKLPEGMYSCRSYFSGQRSLGMTRSP